MSEASDFMKNEVPMHKQSCGYLYLCDGQIEKGLYTSAVLEIKYRHGDKEFSAAIEISGNDQEEKSYFARVSIITEHGPERLIAATVNYFDAGSMQACLTTFIPRSAEVCENLIRMIHASFFATIFFDGAPKNEKGEVHTTWYCGFGRMESYVIQKNSGTSIPQILASIEELVFSK